MSRRRWLRLLLLSGLIAGCASPWGNESAEWSGQDPPQAVRIKAALIREPGLAGSAIDVQFVDGRVTLEGFVESQKQRSRAGSIAGQQQGVKRVVNEILVK